MNARQVWYAVLGILPAYSAYNGSKLYGDLWKGLIAGLFLAAILYALGEVMLEANEARFDTLGLSVIALTIVRGKFLFMTGTCTFYSVADVSRCNSLVKTWLSALHAANP